MRKKLIALLLTLTFVIAKAQITPMTQVSEWPIPPSFCPSCVPGADAYTPLVTNSTDKPGWTLTWQDEFNGTSLDLNKWHVKTGTNNTSLYYINGASNVEVSGGSLKLKARIQSGVYTDPSSGISNYYKYTCGWINSIQNNFGPGKYYEIRCKLPSGKSFWPCFWAMHWPCQPWHEVDFLENPNCTPGAKVLGSNTHLGPDCSNSSNNQHPRDNHVATGMPDVESSFYTIGILWESNHLTWFINNHIQRMLSVDVPTQPSDLEFDVWLNSALPLLSDDELAGRFPGIFEIDYVRVYDKKCEPQSVLSDYCYGQGFTDQSDRTREMADVNGDGLDDIIAYGYSYVKVSLANGTGGFGTPQYVLQNFTKEQGYVNQNLHPRIIGDVNGDHKADIVAFGVNYTAISLSTSYGNTASFSQLYNGVNAYAQINGYTDNETYPRKLGDVNGDGKMDIIAFGPAGVYVSLAVVNGGIPSFTSPQLVISNYGTNQGFSNQSTYNRQIGDFNGDHKADIVAYGYGYTLVSLSTTIGNTISYTSPQYVLNDFTVTQGYSSFDAYPRLIGDLNNDGKDDIVAFGYGAAYASLSTCSGNLASFVGPGFCDDFLCNSMGWSSYNTYPRFIKDMNNDGKADIVGFGPGEVIIIKSNCTGNSLSFDGHKNVTYQFTRNENWATNSQYPRFLANINGDLNPDIVGFGLASVSSYVCVDPAKRINNSDDISLDITYPSLAAEDLITIFPNPSDGELTIHNNGNGAIQQVTIFNAMGQVELSLNDINNRSVSLNIKDFLAGIYILKIEMEKNGIFTKKIIKN